MMRSQRLTHILDVLAREGSITVEEIIETLDVSPATARRDLDALAERGLLHRTRGGARAAVVAFDSPLNQKRGHNTEEKNAIAAWCIKQLFPGCLIGMSGGTTVGAIASQLVEWAQEHAAADPTYGRTIATVVTNALDIASQLAQTPSVKVVLVGGILNGSSFELTGPLSVENLQNFSLDFAFIGANGIDADGPGTVDEFEAQTNQTMAARATTPIVVADSSKFGRRSFSSLGGPERASLIITDTGVKPSEVKLLQQKGYSIVQVSPEEAMLGKNAS